MRRARSFIRERRPACQALADLPPRPCVRISRISRICGVPGLPPRPCVRISQIYHLGPVAVQSLVLQVAATLEGMLSGSRGFSASALCQDLGDLPPQPCAWPTRHRVAFPLLTQHFHFRRSLFLSHLFHIPCSRVLLIPSPLISPPLLPVHKTRSSS